MNNGLLCCRHMAGYSIYRDLSPLGLVAGMRRRQYPAAPIVAVKCSFAHWQNYRRVLTQRRFFTNPPRKESEPSVLDAPDGELEIAGQPVYGEPGCKNCGRIRVNRIKFKGHSNISRVVRGPQIAAMTAPACSGPSLHP